MSFSVSLRSSFFLRLAIQAASQIRLQSAILCKCSLSPNQILCRTGLGLTPFVVRTRLSCHRMSDVEPDKGQAGLRRITPLPPVCSSAVSPLGICEFVLFYRPCRSRRWTRDLGSPGRSILEYDFAAVEESAKPHRDLLGVGVELLAKDFQSNLFTHF